MRYEVWEAKVERNKNLKETLDGIGWGKGKLKMKKKGGREEEERSLGEEKDQRKIKKTR